MTIGPEDDLEAVDVDAHLNQGGAEGVLTVLLNGGRRLGISLDRRTFEQLADRMRREISRVEPPAGYL